ncbi:pilus assembly protein PilM [Patescibacteria group bacterium]|nr:pilus assembly protein PilM [Patescibacteria group bacterium]
MIWKYIFEALPTPKILDIPYAGVAISDTAIRCIQFGMKDSMLFIEKFSEKPLAPGIIVSGQINKMEEVVSTLEELKKELHLDYVKISLPEEKAYLFTAKIPIIRQEEVRSAIDSKIEENVPVSPAELIFDYRIIDHRAKGHLDVVVSTLPITLVDTYVNMAKSAKLTLLSLEIESQAIARALLPKKVDVTSLIVHYGPEKVGLYVISNGLVHFTSTIPTMGQSKNNSEFLLQEIKKLYVYWHTLKENVDKPEKKISEILVCGENFNDEAVNYIRANNVTEVMVGNVWLNAFDINKSLPIIPFKDSLKYAAAVGLALPSDILI